MLRTKVMMAAYFTCGIMSVFPGLTRAMGYSVLPMICTLIGACLVEYYGHYILYLVSYNNNALYMLSNNLGIGRPGAGRLLLYARRQIVRPLLYS